jgi:hypothetical protein
MKSPIYMLIMIGAVAIILAPLITLSDCAEAQTVESDLGECKMGAIKIEATGRQGAEGWANEYLRACMEAKGYKLTTVSPSEAYLSIEQILSGNAYRSPEAERLVRAGCLLGPDGQGTEFKLRMPTCWEKK